MHESFEMTETFTVPPKVVYEAWLGGKSHAAMTGSPAESDPKTGGRFSAWDGYISGTHRSLEAGKRIVQFWRTTEFPEESPDSTLELLFEETEGGTKLTLRHSGIPDGQAEAYKQGWIDYYFNPMKDYFYNLFTTR